MCANDLQAAETDEAGVEGGGVHVADVAGNPKTRFDFGREERLRGRQADTVDFSRHLGATGGERERGMTHNIDHGDAKRRGRIGSLEDRLRAPALAAECWERSGRACPQVCTVHKKYLDSSEHCGHLKLEKLPPPPLRSFLSRPCYRPSSYRRQ